MSDRCTATAIAHRLLHEVILSSAPGGMLPPERELARVMNAGRNTVRRAISELHDDGWLSTIPGHGHRITHPQRELGSTVGVLCGFDAQVRLARPFYAALFAGVELAAGAHDLHVLRISNAHRYEQIARLPAAVRRAERLLAIDIDDLDLLSTVCQLATTVCVDCECRAPGASSISFDHTGAVRMAVKYLQDLGHRRIALAVPQAGTIAAINSYLDAFRVAMRWLDCGDVEKSIYRLLPHETVRQSLAGLLSSSVGARASAIVVVDQALPVMMEIMATGLGVPQDISVVCVCDAAMLKNTLCGSSLEAKLDNGDVGMAQTATRLWATAGGLRPTIVNVPALRMGMLAVQELVQRGTGGGRPASRHVLTPDLVVGNSTARRD